MPSRVRSTAATAWPRPAKKRAWRPAPAARSSTAPPFSTRWAKRRIQADLEDGSPWPLGERRFAGIVVTNYLHRPLLPRLAHALQPGGVLIYETFAVGQGAFGRPSAENYLLRPNELIGVFAPLLTVVAFEHGIDYAPNPKAVQRLAAVKGRDLVPL